MNKNTLKDLQFSLIISDSILTTVIMIQNWWKGSCNGQVMVIFDMLWNLWNCFQHTLKSLTWFSTHLEIFDMVFNTSWNFWHGFQHSFHMVHNIGEFQNSTFDIFHTFNAKSSLTFMLCPYKDFTHISGWVQLQFDCNCFKCLCLKTCWKLQVILKTLTHVKNILKKYFENSNMCWNLYCM